MSQIIKVNKTLFTEDSPISVHEIVVGDTPIYKGGFGFIYNCISVNGMPYRAPLLIKLFKNNKNSSSISYTSIVRLQNKMKSLFSRGMIFGYRNIIDIPALKGFPIFSFEGILNRELIQGYSAINLTHFGFISFDNVINETGINQDSFKQLSFKTRFKFCFHLALGFKVLNEINYVHADINPKNLFINIDAGEAVIIDYDGGCVIESSTDVPLTFGKLDDGEWLAPEIYDKEETNQEVVVDKYADRWSISIAFHYFIFNYDPFFFIKEQSKRCKEEYLISNKLYPINLMSFNVSEYAAYVVDSYENVIMNYIPDSIHQELVKNYEEGFFYPQRRTSYHKWVEIFTQTQDPPEIEYFRSSKDFIFKETQVKLCWEVKDANELIVDNNIGDVTYKNEITIRPCQHMTYHLTARNHFGETKRSVDITVFPIPIIEYLKVPEPTFQTLLTIPKIIIESPVINITQLEKNKLIQMPDTFFMLSKELIQAKPPYNNRSNFWSMSNIFDKIKRVITFK